MEILSKKAHPVLVTFASVGCQHTFWTVLITAYYTTYWLLIDYDIALTVRIRAEPARRVFADLAGDQYLIVSELLFLGQSHVYI